MLKIKTLNKSLLITNPAGRSIKFELSDKKLFGVIEKNINKINKDGCVVSIEKKSNRTNYLILDNYKIIVNDITAYEIGHRMLLLNKTLKVPIANKERQEEDA